MTRAGLVSFLTFFSSAAAAVALYLSVVDVSERTATNRRLIDLERPRTAAELRAGIKTATRACIEAPACRRVVFVLVERSAREEAARRRRKARRASTARESRRRGASRGASRPPSGTRAGSDTRPGLNGREPLGGSRPPRRSAGRRPSPGSAPTPASSSPGSSPPPSSPSPPRPTVDVQTPPAVPAPRPTACTTLVGVNC